MIPIGDGLADAQRIADGQGDVADPDTVGIPKAQSAGRLRASIFSTARVAGRIGAEHFCSEDAAIH